MIKWIVIGLLGAYLFVSQSVFAASEKLPDGLPLEKRKGAFDHSLELKPISDPHMLLSHFSNRDLVIFFFSVKCIHCQNAFPHIQQLDSELRSLGVSTIAVSIQNNTEQDIRSFIREHQCDFPVFQDAKRLFSKKYGTGSIPLVIAVRSSGAYRRMQKLDKEKTIDQLRVFFTK